MNKQLILWMVYIRVFANFEFTVTTVGWFDICYVTCTRLSDNRSWLNPFLVRGMTYVLVSALPNLYFKEILVACHLISLNSDFSNWEINQIF